jgi:hypothetical protein
MTLGYHANSVAESANHMMKHYLPTPIHNLDQIREWHTCSYQAIAMSVRHPMERQFHRAHVSGDLSHDSVQICDNERKHTLESDRCLFSDSSKSGSCFHSGIHRLKHSAEAAILLLCVDHYNVNSKTESEVPLSAICTRRCTNADALFRHCGDVSVPQPLKKNTDELHRNRISGSVD